MTASWAGRLGVGGIEKKKKDTWTKPRGRVEARKGGGFGWGGVGGNADYCN